MDDELLSQFKKYLKERFKKLDYQVRIWEGGTRRNRNIIEVVAGQQSRLIYTKVSNKKGQAFWGISRSQLNAIEQHDGDSVIILLDASINSGYILSTGQVKGQEWSSNQDNSEYKIRPYMLKRNTFLEKFEALRHLFSLLPIPVPNTPIATDITEPPQERVQTITYRVLRDTSLARRIKEENGYKCQKCGSQLRLSDGKLYAEAHHLMPLGLPHSGPDIRENIICLCPNCHVLFDYGAIRIDPAIFPADKKEYLDYHNAEVFGRQI